MVQVGPRAATSAAPQTPAAPPATPDQAQPVVEDRPKRRRYSVEIPIDPEYLPFIGLMFVLGSLGYVFVIIPATAFYLFEVIIVVSIQAFIFAALSAIYIGSAIEPEH